MNQQLSKRTNDSGARTAFVIACTAVIVCFWVTISFAANWEGVDKTVVEKIAAQNGQAPAKPLIDTSQGDVLLFVFLIAGVISGFILGYYWRVIFVDHRQKHKPQEDQRIHVTHSKKSDDAAVKIRIKNQDPSGGQRPKLRLIHREKDTDEKG